jgi:hypothetical protein
MSRTFARETNPRSPLRRRPPPPPQGSAAARGGSRWQRADDPRTLAGQLQAASRDGTETDAAGSRGSRPARSLCPWHARRDDRLSRDGAGGSIRCRAGLPLGRLVAGTLSPPTSGGVLPEATDAARRYAGFALDVPSAPNVGGTEVGCPKSRGDADTARRGAQLRYVSYVTTRVRLPCRVRERSLRVPLDAFLPARALASVRFHAP